jgi:NADH:ubiquinone oxidoreductase subunit K
MPSILLVVVCVLAVVGFPCVAWRYRVLCLGLTILLVGTSVQFLATAVVNSHYLHDHDVWPLVVAFLSVCAAGITAFEGLTLRWHRKRGHGKWTEPFVTAQERKSPVAPPPGDAGR